MKLTVVGCSGSGPGPKSPASCYLVEHDGFRLLLDLGNGAFGPLQSYVDPAAIDAVFLSHLHADHCLDIAPFVVWHRYSGRVRRTARCRCTRRSGPSGGWRWPTTPTATGSPTSSTSCRWGRASFSLGPFEVDARPHGAPGRVLRHPADRRTGGRWSTPATPARASASSSSRAAPTCCWPRRRTRPARTCPPGCTSPAGRPASTPPRPGVGRLLLTHIPAWVDEIGQLFAASAVFSETELVRSGAIYEI